MQNLTQLWDPKFVAKRARVRIELEHAPGTGGAGRRLKISTWRCSPSLTGAAATPIGPRPARRRYGRHSESAATGRRSPLVGTGTARRRRSRSMSYSSVMSWRQRFMQPRDQSSPPTCTVRAHRNPFAAGTVALARQLRHCGLYLRVRPRIIR